jgi:hypothetical protein
MYHSAIDLGSLSRSNVCTPGKAEYLHQDLYSLFLINCIADCITIINHLSKYSGLFWQHK